MAEHPLSPTLYFSEAKTPPPPSMHAQVAFVEGSAPRQETDTERVLRKRLAAVTAVLGLGFAAYLVQDIVLRAAAHNISDYGRVIFDGWFCAFHASVTAVLAGVYVLLMRRQDLPLRVLRKLELVTFGLPGLFFAVLQLRYVDEWVSIGSTESATFSTVSTAAFWLMLIYSYGLFVPSTWRRAAVTTGTMVAVSIAITTWQWMHYGAAQTGVNTTGLMVIELMLVLAAAGSVYGASIIRALRTEAFVARRFGQYVLKERIGSGGMGEVYLAEHVLLKRPCAVKIIRPGQATDPGVLARFEREVHATAKLSHWNTVEIYDYGHTEDGTFYYVMEYLPGLSLDELCRQHGPQPPERVVYLLRQICSALTEAHSAGLIHRDVKPGNIIAAYRGGQHDVVKLLDFGLVKPRAEREDSAITQLGSLAGSPLYMSPEQSLGKGEPDVRSDIYSLGTVAYFLLTGHPPFEGTEPMEVLVAHARDAVRPPRELVPDIPADLEQVVLRALEKDPEARFQTAVEMERALAEGHCAADWNPQVAEAWWNRQSEEPEFELSHSA